MKKVLIFFIVVVWLVAASVNLVWAARTRPPRGSGTGQPVARSYSRGIKSSVKFKSDRNGLLINFSGFSSSIDSVSYTLSYNANGIPQGAMGTVTADTSGEQREVLFGTCSGGVCRYHTNITDAKLVIDTKLTNGLIVRKPYRIRI